MNLCSDLELTVRVFHKQGIGLGVKFWPCFTYSMINTSSSNRIVHICIWLPHICNNSLLCTVCFHYLEFFFADKLSAEIQEKLDYITGKKTRHSVADIASVPSEEDNGSSEQTQEQPSHQELDIHSTITQPTDDDYFDEMVMNYFR